MSEQVNGPAHYGGTATIDRMVEKHGVEPVRHFCLLNADKYRDRAGKKPGNSEEQDLAKAAWYDNYRAQLPINPMETIKFKLLHPDAKLPTRAHETDACFDVVATSCKDVTDGIITYGLGFATEIPVGWAGYFYPRSSISNYSLVLCNSVGIIDAGYRGEWQARFQVTKHTFADLYKVGDRIGQIRFAPLPFYTLALADELSNTARGTGGFGSTGQQ
jgi:dUTP diphosphatase